MSRVGSIFCVGLNHRSATVGLREKLAFSEKDLPEASRSICSLDGVNEAVVLSTCNRTEIYGSDTRASKGSSAIADRLKRFLVDRFQLGGVELPLYAYTEREAARHLFQVASGLDSMVLGETEIFGQVKKAYATALNAGTTGKNLNQLFQYSFKIGKLVRNETRIQRGATSVGSVAVELAEKIFGDLKRCRVLLIGAGDMSRRTAMSLRSRGANSIFVSNRSFERARELAGELDASAVRFDDWPEQIPFADIVISSTAAPHTLIRPEHVAPALRKRRGRPLFMIDIAVPRDIDPEIDRLADVYLFDIDALEAIAADAKRRREDQIRKCNVIIQTHLDENTGLYIPVSAGALSKGDDSGSENAQPVPSA
jgi:glutamyl-tRNA reductase